MTSVDVIRAVGLIYSNKQIELEGFRFISGSTVPGHRFFNVFVHGRLLAVVEFRGNAHVNMERYSSAGTWHRNLLCEALQGLGYDITELSDERFVSEIRDVLSNVVPC